MKTAISLPDPLFHAAEQYAQEHNLSRSELYARALQQYLTSNQSQGVTEALDQIYTAEDSRIAPPLIAAQSRSLPPEEW
jgi:metal-responsive CopG/Arc/MetJ family transcriptional regulator